MAGRSTDPNYKVQSEAKVLVKRVTYAEDAENGKVQETKTWEIEKNISQNNDTDEINENAIEDEESRRRLNDIVMRTRSAIDAYGTIPEKKLSKDGLRISSEEIEAKINIMHRIRYMRSENLHYMSMPGGNGLKPKVSNSAVSDFDVTSIVKSDTGSLKTKKAEKDLENDSYIEFLRGRRKTFGPSGLVETDKWDEILNRSRVRNMSSIAVIPLAEQTTRRQKATRVVDVKKFPIRESPITTYCPVCNRDVETLISYEHGLFTFVAAFICCFIFPVLILCAWIPFLFTNFMDKKHSCPKCGTRLGTSERIPQAC